MLYPELVAVHFAKPAPQDLSKPSDEDAYYRAKQGTGIRLPHPARIFAAFAALLAPGARHRLWLQHRWLRRGRAML